ncbi:crossover junction endodeoxyribonuclease RuvC [Echinicola vietnamensis]|uniref:Crossover junction endodeoxyribonuclease RuvC n=1 Tax=Echinicola vietnamensis (strain DSM 17526 / LMG 23754 / KMM 6221) TaxID=926556 RepID=L0FR06_ECHVK|nr:crossover junction endodeoxyribonuclease RuvC [Echinicola vietnamensis]AGA76384.1 crossover junction endodeoxyribonuclease RuvC [Echinicola vietnamensis DSM 17526]
MSKIAKKDVKEQIILGIDPGTNVMGYGLVLVKGNKYEPLQFGVIHLKKYGSHELKLKKIFERVTGIIDEFLPDKVALEAPFYGQNVQSMLKLGRAQGVAMAAALARDIPIAEYSPKKVKQSVTGNGNASKEQVAEMLKTLLHIDVPKLLDATDALAVALCHHFHDGRLQTRGRTAGWKAFLDENPGRIK